MKERYRDTWMAVSKVLNGAAAAAVQMSNEEEEWWANIEREEH